jgi:hypothetical protein
MSSLYSWPAPADGSRLVPCGMLSTAFKHAANRQPAGCWCAAKKRLAGARGHGFGSASMDAAVVALHSAGGQARGASAEHGCRCGRGGGTFGVALVAGDLAEVQERDEGVAAVQVVVLGPPPALERVHLGVVLPRACIRGRSGMRPTGFQVLSKASTCICRVQRVGCRGLFVPLDAPSCRTQHFVCQHCMGRL